MADTLAKLAMADPRLKAMVDQAASSGATLPDDECDELPAGKPSPLKITAAPGHRSGGRRSGRPLAWAAGIAAGVLCVAGLLALGESSIPSSGGYRYADENPVMRYSSGAARRAVTLDDGTRVYLDVASIIEVRFDAASRDVTLVQGRAVFDAAHDAARPFVVTVDTERVTALGTIFQIDREPSAVVVTLAQGVVTVTSKSSSAAVQLLPNEELRSSAGSTRWTKRSVDAQSVTSWSHDPRLTHDIALGSDPAHEIKR